MSKQEKTVYYHEFLEIMHKSPHRKEWVNRTCPWLVSRCKNVSQINGDKEAQRRIKTIVKIPLENLVQVKSIGKTKAL
jgi:hypothetical protein